MKSGQSAVTVVLPYRDAEDTLAEAVDSILAQRQVDVALVAVDDGSRDGGPALLARLAARHRGLRCLSSPGPGIANALNHGITATSGPQLARMDADDVAHPDRLAVQLDALASAPAVAALGSRVEAFPERHVDEGMRRYLQWQNGLQSPDEHAAQLFVESPLCHPSVMLRRAALEAVGGYRDGDFPEDYDLWLRLHAAGYGLAKVPQPLLRWRQGPHQATRTDPRYGRARFLATKAPHLARVLRGQSRPLDLWGAGKAGRHLLRSLEPYGIRARRFIDIDPKKLSHTARGLPIEPPEALYPPGHPEAGFVLVAVAARGARDQVRAHLTHLGAQEGPDFLCAT